MGNGNDQPGSVYYTQNQKRIRVFEFMCAMVYLQLINTKLMKNHFKFIAIFGLTFLMASCTGEEQNQDNTTSDVETTQADTRTTRGMNALNVKLNDGHPWEANPETVLGIEKMTVLIDDFEKEKYDPASYKNLSHALMEQFDYIFQECTMKGEAHDQLHNYLLPMKVYFEELNSDDPKVAENSLEKFDHHLKVFPKYFKG